MSASLISLALSAAIAAGVAGQERKREPIEFEAWEACGASTSPADENATHSSGRVFVGTDGVALFATRESYQTAEFAAKAFARRVSEGVKSAAAEGRAAGTVGERRAVVRLAGERVPLAYAPGFVEKRVALYWTEGATLHAVVGPDVERVLACAGATAPAPSASAGE